MFGLGSRGERSREAIEVGSKQSRVRGTRRCAGTTARGIEHRLLARFGFEVPVRDSSAGGAALRYQLQTKRSTRAGERVGKIGEARARPQGLEAVELPRLERASNARRRLPQDAGGSEKTIRTAPWCRLVSNSQAVWPMAAEDTAVRGRPGGWVRAVYSEPIQSPGDPEAPVGIETRRSRDSLLDGMSPKEECREPWEEVRED